MNESLDAINLVYWRDGFHSLFAKWEAQQDMIRDLRQALVNLQAEQDCNGSVQLGWRYQPLIQQATDVLSS